MDRTCKRSPVGRRKWRVAAWSAVALLLGGSQCLAGGDDGWPDPPWPAHDWFYEGYRISTTDIPDVGERDFLVADRAGVLFSATDFVWSIGAWPNEHIAIGDDITGDGIPNLVVDGYSGGAHCCTTTWLFEVGEEFRLVGAYGGGDYPVRFRQLDERPGLDLIQFENAFAYWYVGFSLDPVPEVYFRWQDGEYLPAPVLMHQDPPSDEKLRQIAQEFSTHEQWRHAWTESRIPVPTDLLSVFLGLAYSGNLDAANRLNDLAWPADLDGKEAFRYEFFCQLQRADFWDIVAPLNGLEATPPAADCPDDARWR